MIGENILNVKTEDYIEHILDMCTIFIKWNTSSASFADKVKKYKEYLDAYAAIEIKLIALGLNFKPIKFIEEDFNTNISRITKFFLALEDEYKMEERKLLTKETIEISRNKYKKKLNIGFYYSFSDGDLERIQTLINELRESITKSILFSDEHKERILKKLESLQLELHKKMSSLDKLWGFVGEAGVVLGKFGKDAEPFFERLKEIAHITWRTQVIAEQLTSGASFPLLTDNKPEEK